ncbi:MAG: DUF2513 domain-containing protein [Alloacidobacterium sp.]|jgi:hypothetical protein
MIRDLELFRKVLIETEQVPPGQWQRIAVEGATPEETCYHMRLAFEARLIEARFMDDSAKDFVVRRLTYSGHEFLDAARSDTLWATAKEWMMESTGALTVEGLKVALQQEVKAAILLSRRTTCQIPL